MKRQGARDCEGSARRGGWSVGRGSSPMPQKTSIHRLLNDGASKKSAPVQDGGDAGRLAESAIGHWTPPRTRTGAHIQISCRNTGWRTRGEKGPQGGRTQRAHVHPCPYHAPLAPPGVGFWGAAHRRAGLIEHVDDGASSHARLGRARRAAAEPQGPEARASSAKSQRAIGLQTPARCLLMTAATYNIWGICSPGIAAHHLAS